MKSVKDKLVLITGGAGGIGRLMAFEFARRGAKVAVWDLNPTALAALEDEARREGFNIRGMVCDVSDREAVYRQAGALGAEMGPLDILVNNAGVVSGKTLLETPDEKIIKTMNVNVLPLFWTVKAFLPSMIERNSGHLVTISSAAGIIGVRGLADYCASKFAAFGFNESVRMELNRLKSRVKTTVICPYFADTGMFLGVKSPFPLLPILKSSYVAQKIVSGVLKNRKCIILPFFVRTVAILRLLPVSVLDFLSDILGVSAAMDHFTGRKEQG
ncbi:MAG: SDR family oxidoreductase [Treponema sp.]|jgi:all-trans-retinol dehydrogenase (NAD+)|nr:SDR family oxidoreductase [Treponema sp.]